MEQKENYTFKLAGILLKPKNITKKLFTSRDMIGRIQWCRDFLKKHT